MCSARPSRYIVQLKWVNNLNASNLVMQFYFVYDQNTGSLQHKAGRSPECTMDRQIHAQNFKRTARVYYDCAVILTTPGVELPLGIAFHSLY